MNEMYFEVPDDPEVMAKLVEAMPDWQMLDGSLWTPQPLIDSGEALEKTGIVLSRFHSIRPTLQGMADGGMVSGLNPTDLFAVLVDNKKPGFILFDEAGYQERVVTMELSKKFAAAFLRKGYRGRLNFYRDCDDDDKFRNSARCTLAFSSPGNVPNPKFKVPWVSVEWDPAFSEEYLGVSQILSVCRTCALLERVVTPPFR